MGGIPTLLIDNPYELNWYIMYKYVVLLAKINIWLST